MEYQSFRAAFMALLRLHGQSDSPADILLAMEAPYLFLQREGRAVSGTGFFSPQWLHLYLRPRGLMLTPHTLPRADVPAFLKNSCPAILQLPENKHLVIAARQDRRISLVQPKSADTPERWITLATLRRHLPEAVTAYTLDACTPEDANFIPLLVESAQTLACYGEVLLSLLSRTVTREDMAALHSRYFRALMVELPPFAPYFDDEIAEVLLLLHHAYRHLFTIGEEAVTLGERLPKRRILMCLTWLRECVIDRLYDLGAPEELLSQLYQSPKK